MQEPPAVPQALRTQERADSGALDALSDAQLLLEVARLASREREATADLVHALGEIDARKLFLKEGCASLFTYCTERLHLSEHAAYRRIEAARLARRLPLVLQRLRDGAMTLTAAGLLGPHLTEDNCREILDAVRHKSKRAVEEVVARLRPQPDLPASIRRLPQPRADVPLAPAAAVVGDDRKRGLLLDASGDGRQDVSRGASRDPKSARLVSGRPPIGDGPHDGGRVSVGARPAEIRPLSPASYSLHVTISAETQRKLRQAQELLRHVVPTGDPAEIIDRALTLLVAHVERRKHAELRPKGARKRRALEVGTMPESEVPDNAGVGSAAPSDGPMLGSSTRQRAGRRRARYIPAAVRRAVWERDGGQCTFVGAGGRCTERAFLEFHHRVPFADGGASAVENITLLCKAHNGYEAARFAPLVAREQSVAYQLGPGPSRSPGLKPRGRPMILGHGVWLGSGTGPFLSSWDPASAGFERGAG